MARKFLYIVAGLIVLVLLAGVTWSLWSERLLKLALVPGTAFTAPAPRDAGAYRNAALWYARQGSRASAPPPGAPGVPPVPTDRQAAIFFVHPTSYLGRASWNAPAAAGTADDLARRYVALQSNIFSGLGPVWAPRYRQATFGAFLTDRPEAGRALDAAEGDVVAAFDAFVAANPRGPIILAGHSQGARHLLHVLARRVAGRPVARRIVAAYLVGWPVSVTADLPALGLPACDRAADARCILSWQSFAPPAETAYLDRSYGRARGLADRPRRGTPMLCTNPLTGRRGGAAPPSANLGMTRADFQDGGQAFVRPGVGATCDARGFLILTSAPDLGPFVLPGNNYHVYDYSLFWANVRADARRRLEAWWAR